MFKGSFKGVPRKFLEWFKKVLRLFQQGCFKKGSRVFNGDIIEFHGCPKAVQRAFKRSLNGVSVLRTLKGD